MAAPAANLSWQAGTGLPERVLGKLKQVELGLTLDDKLPPVEADDGQLRQALLALLMNALDATNPHGHVTIETKREGCSPNHSPDYGGRRHGRPSPRGERRRVANTLIIGRFTPINVRSNVDGRTLRSWRRNHPTPILSAFTR